MREGGGKEEMREGGGKEEMREGRDEGGDR